MARAKRAGYYTVSLDLFRIANAAQLAETLVAEHDLQPASAVPNPPSRPRGRAPRRRCRRHNRRRSGLRTSSVTSSRSPSSLAWPTAIPSATSSTRSALPQRIAVDDGKHVVLFIDEFQEVANPRKPYGDPDAVTKRMRAIFQRSPDVSFLFAGSYEHVLRELFGRARQAFGHFGSIYELPPDRVGRVAQGPPRPLRRRRLHRPPRGARAPARARRRTSPNDDAPRPEDAPPVDPRRHEDDRRDARRAGPALGDARRPRHSRPDRRADPPDPPACAAGRAPDRARGVAVPRPEVRRGVPGAEGPRARRHRRPAGPRRWRILEPLLARYLRELEPLG